MRLSCRFWSYWPNKVPIYLVMSSYCCVDSTYRHKYQLGFRGIVMGQRVGWHLINGLLNAPFGLLKCRSFLRAAAKYNFSPYVFHYLGGWSPALGGVFGCSGWRSLHGLSGSLRASTSTVLVIGGSRDPWQQRQRWRWSIYYHHNRRGRRLRLLLSAVFIRFSLSL